MSKNVEALRPIYAEWSRGNFRPKFDVYDPEMEWGWSSDFPGLAGVYRDPAERNARLHEWLSPWEEWQCEAEEFIEHGDYVVALCRYQGRGKGSGATVDTRGAHVWKLRDGKVVRLEVFADRVRALESIGLTEAKTPFSGGP
jgi:ketosteroid isomerase-like protein